MQWYKHSVKEKIVRIVKKMFLQVEIIRIVENEKDKNILDLTILTSSLTTGAKEKILLICCTVYK